MNRTQKIVWTTYLLIFVVLYFSQSTLSLSKPRVISPEEVKMIAKGIGNLTPTWSEVLWSRFLYLGWIPTLTLHFIWRGKKKK